MAPSHPHLLLFDLDGTLTDNAPGIFACIRHALRELGFPAPVESDLRRAIGPPLHISFREIFGIMDEAVVMDAMRIYRERFSAVGLLENDVYPGIPDALSSLAEAGFRLRVATSKPKVFADRIIDHFQLRPFFPEVYGSELSGERAGKPELVRYVLESEGASPGATCMIGDRSHDMVGARENGLTAVGVLWG
jgi:phosphoglycolate phosphatase